MAKRATPQSYRRLTRAEATRKGVKYSSKFQVDAAIPKGKATKRTATISNRQAHQFTISKTTGVRQSKEKFSATRVTPTISFTKNGKEVLTYKNLSKRELNKVLRENKHRPVVLLIHGEFGGGGRSGAAGGVGWRHGWTDIDAEELLNEDHFDDYVASSGALHRPDRYGAVFR